MGEKLLLRAEQDCNTIFLSLSCKLNEKHKNRKSSAQFKGIVGIVELKIYKN